ncbi:MAG TPA: hypothetical protein VFJ16_08975 [Longimicrobium sp.]|nr:hypothetical protein [Longimicrobium sp.]
MADEIDLGGGVLAALETRQLRFAAAEQAARGGLNALEEELRSPRVPGIAVVARSPDELLLTFAGWGFCFRFAWSATKWYLLFGTWRTTRKGFRAYDTVLKWEIDGERIGPAGDRAALRKLLYVALGEFFTRRAKREKELPYDLLESRHSLREFDPGAAPRPASGTP